MNLARRRLEGNHVSLILHGFDIAVQRLPVVGDDDHLAFRGEFAWNAFPLQLACSRVAGYPLLRLGLAQTFQKPDAVLA